MGTLSLFHILLIFALFIIPVIAILLFRGRANRASTAFHSLKLTSPLLIALILVFTATRTFLSNPDAMNGLLSAHWRDALTGLTLIALAGAVVSGALFYYKALANLNFFSGRIILSPIFSLLGLIPFVNFIGLPAIQYVAYRNSLLLFPNLSISRATAALTTIGAMVLTLVGIAGHVSRDVAMLVGLEDATPIWIAGTCASFAGGLLLSRIVSRITAAQEAYAQSPASPPKNIGDRKEKIQTLAIGALLLLAIISLIAPAFVSNLVSQVLGLGSIPHP